MWQVMIESAMGKPQYFHGIDWDEWKPQYVETVKTKRSRAISESIRDRNLRVGMQTRAKVLACLQEAKKCLAGDICKAIGLSDTRTRVVLREMLAEGLVNYKTISGQFGPIKYWMAK